MNILKINLVRILMTNKLLKNLEAEEGVQGIVAGLEEFNEVVKSLSEQSNKIKDSLPKLSLEISKAIQTNPQVTLQKVGYV